jgi:4-amino-4-deoxychorismate lyase
MILINGMEDAAISAADRGLAYGDGVFRTIRVQDGHALQWSRHYAKLAADCKALRIPVPELETLNQDVMRISRAHSTCALKIIVTRGVGERGYAHAGVGAPTRILLSAPLPRYPSQCAELGVRIRLCRLKLADQPALAGVKHLNRLENVLARAEWTDSSIAEGIVRDRAENVIGGTMTNIFMVNGGVLATPRLDGCGIAGVTRDRIIETSARHGAPCEVTMLTWSDIVSAEEVFLVNSLIGVWPVCDIEGQLRRAGPFTRLAQRWLTLEDDAQAA